jgi:hypothetical protein
VTLRPSDEALIAPLPDPLPIAVRAFAPPPGKPSDKKGPRKRGGGLASPSQWTLIFDTETTIDASQRIRIGAYQFRKSDELDEAGIFYDPAAFEAAEIEALKQFTGDNNLHLRTVSVFVDQVLYDRAYDLRASIVGFNLPFDISRLAFRHGSARGRAMRGGFTFKLSRQWWRPAIQVRHLNAAPH